MNIFYTKTSEWELDFFKNDIFNSDSYDVNINFILFDNNTTIENKNYNLNYKNVIACNKVINLNYLESLIIKLKPFVILIVGFLCNLFNLKQISSDTDVIKSAYFPTVSFSFF